MEDKEFKVVDKRRFTEEGESTGKEKAEEVKTAPEASSQSAPQAGPQSFPPIDFSTFILSLSTSALLHLGEIPNPETKKQEKNLELARHTIDLIDMLKQKTKGNLTENEAGLIEHALYDLRMRFVQAQNK